MFGKESEKMNIGDKILELRKKKGITQEQLGDLLGVARQTISKWELNETSPNLEQTKNLAKILEVNIEEITSGDNLKKEEKQNDFFKIVINVLKIIFLIVIIVVIVLISCMFFGYNAILLTLILAIIAGLWMRIVGVPAFLRDINKKYIWFVIAVNMALVIGAIILFTIHYGQTAPDVMVNISDVSGVIN